MISSVSIYGTQQGRARGRGGGSSDTLTGPEVPCGAAPTSSWHDSMVSAGNSRWVYGNLPKIVLTRRPPGSSVGNDFAVEALAPLR